MKALLILGGVLFLLLAFVLFIAAVVVFLMARKRRSTVTAAVPRPLETVQPAPTQPPVPVVPPPQPPPAPSPVPPLVPLSPTTAPYSPPPDADGTVLTDVRRGQLWGALHATTGPLAGRAFPIEANGFYIGRDRTLSQVVIEQSSISKRHVWVGVRDGVVMAIDQKSTNGTYLNDAKIGITEARLSPGDTLILAGDVARFTYNA
jgi:hypothetical protein